jgi:probable HAF family extracellular repeat protein
MKTLAILFSALCLHGQAIRYTIVQLPAPRGYSGVQGIDLNNLGEVTGGSYSGNAPAFLYAKGPDGKYRMTLLPAVGAMGGTGTGINDHGQISGESAVGANSHGFLYTEGMMTDLGTLGGPSTLVGKINNSGQVTGWSYVTYGPVTSHAFLYDPSSGPQGKMTDLGTLGGKDSMGFAINDKGEVTGQSDLKQGGLHAFLYRTGTDGKARMIDLGTLGGEDSSGTAINNSGQITGYSFTSDKSSRAFLFSNGAMKDLGALGGSASQGNSINNKGQITGWAHTKDETRAAFLYSGGKMFDLNTLINPALHIFLDVGVAINDAGQILATSYGTSTYLLTPVPGAR